MKLNLVKDVKGNKKEFSRYISIKRHTRGNVNLLLNGSGDVVTKHTEKTKVPNISFQQSQAPETDGEDLPLAEQDHVKEYFNIIDRHKSMGPDG